MVDETGKSNHWLCHSNRVCDWARSAGLGILYLSQQVTVVDFILFLEDSLARRGKSSYRAPSRFSTGLGCISDRDDEAPSCHHVIQRTDVHCCICAIQNGYRYIRQSRIRMLAFTFILKLRAPELPVLRMWLPRFRDSATLEYISHSVSSIVLYPLPPPRGYVTVQQYIVRDLL